MNKEMLLGIGRVVLINYGPNEGKIAVVVDLINQNRVLIEGPGLGVCRQSISTKRLTLTKFRIKDYTIGDSSSSLRKKIEAFNLQEKFGASGIGKKIKKQKRRAELNDFERFKAMVLRRRLSKIVRTNLNKVKKTLAKS